jgi:hypothetical protein
MTAVPPAQRQAKRRAQAAMAREATAELLPRAEQLALPVAELRAAGREAGLPLGPVAEQEPMEAKGGRPKGAVGRRFADWQAFLLGRYRSPLVVLAETYSRDLASLVRELGCTPLEAFQLQLRAAQELAPFLHSKAPTALQLDGAPVAAIQIAVTPAIAAGIGIAASDLPEIVSDQGDSGEDKA